MHELYSLIQKYGLKLCSVFIHAFMLEGKGLRLLYWLSILRIKSFFAVIIIEIIIRFTRLLGIVMNCLYINE
jgi:hypothetical protein